MLTNPKRKLHSYRINDKMINTFNEFAIELLNIFSNNNSCARIFSSFTNHASVKQIFLHIFFIDTLSNRHIIFAQIYLHKK